MKPKCEWTFYDKKKDGDYPTCQNLADAVKRTRSGLWHLCREHCELLVGSYNDKTQIAERPLWRPVR